ncbi:hypothetical protein QFC21_000240 [Naganishia friedmannii]|uniref:Uncharacterized protein n=1 Tax=Naganishia friedmannii TaxID=89922 RepID=A0ACC2WCG0_9TREE|nr:hypothetical protein QFC21_000240 [Naganishia friedmannii]
MFHPIRQILPASRQILRSSSVTPAARPYPALARSLSSTHLVRSDGYDKHRVKVNEPSAGTTNNSMHRSYAQGGKVCVITGGARGIGHMITQAFMESGATQVAILDLRKEDAAQAGEEMVAKFEQAGEYQKGELEVLPVACNVSSEESVKQAFAEVVQRFGRVDCVVNSAGIVENFPAVDYPTDKVKKLIDVNILGSYFVAREAAKVMTAGASIILIGSMSGVVINVPQPQTPYNFSKAAVIHMAKSLAVEWAPKGIRVNCISPGYVLTNLTKVILDANTELRDAWTNMTPMVRPPIAEGLSNHAYWLLARAFAGS